MTEQNSLLPSFFVVGPPRTGTSWLHDILQSHTCLPRVKETRFFDERFSRGLAWYRNHFPSSDLPVGEIGPTYFASPDARHRIAELVPEARVLCIFRHPIDRIRSHYRLKRAYAMIPWEFEEALERDPELTESGKYGTYFEDWLQTFGSENVCGMLYDDLQHSPQSFVNGVADFIGVQRFALATSQASYVHSSEPLTQPRSYYRTRLAGAVADWCKAHHLDRIVTFAKRSPVKRWFLGGGEGFSEMNPRLVNELYERFRPEVEKLENILGRDLSSWKCEEGRLMSAV